MHRRTSVETHSDEQMVNNEMTRLIVPSSRNHRPNGDSTSDAILRSNEEPHNDEEIINDEMRQLLDTSSSQSTLEHSASATTSETRETFYENRDQIASSELLNQFHETEDQLIKDLHFQELLNYTISNDEEKIKELVNKKITGLQTHRYEEYENRTIVVQACIDERVKTKTLDVLLLSILEAYEEIDCIDEQWYGWEPIHYAVSVANPDKLKVIVGIMQNNVNSLTYCSENALHILLNYELEASLHNGNEFKHCMLIGEESENIVKCAKILIDSGIDVNHSNLWNDSPISLAIRYNFHGVIALLLETSYIDIDNCQEANKSVREILRQRNICIKQLNSIDYYQDDPGKIMFSYLKSGDEDNFIHLNNGNIKDYVNLVDGTDDYNASGTMLQFCFKKGFLKYLQSEAYGEKLRESDIMNSPMLSIFCSEGLKKSIEHLLDNGADTHKSTRKIRGSLLEIAAVRGYYPMVAILLQHTNGNIQPDEIFQLLPKLYDKKFETLENHATYRQHVLYLLLNKLTEQHYHKFTEEYHRNFLNNILLKLNLENDDSKVDDCALICQILGLGASMLTRNVPLNNEEHKSIKERLHSFFSLVCQILRFGSSMLERNVSINNNSNTTRIERLYFLFEVIYQQFRFGVSVLKGYISSNNKNKTVLERLHSDIFYKHLDDSLDNNSFFYNSMVRDDMEGYSETEVLSLLNKDDIKKKAYTHPLLEHLIKTKWSKICLIFYLLIIFYGAFVVVICLYMLSVFEGYNYGWLTVCFITMVILQGVKEVFQLVVLYRRSYFKDSINYPEWLVILLCVRFYFCPNVVCFVFAILTSTCIFFVLLGQQSKFAKYTLILGSIKYFLKYSFFYCGVFVSFALCFYVTFPYSDVNTKHFVKNNSTDIEIMTADFLKNLFETLILFTGEFTDRVLNSEHYPFFGRITAAIFIFCMTIILNNLLVGLIVTDMDKIKQEYKLYRIKKMAEFIISINAFFDRIQEYKKSTLNICNLFKKGDVKELILKGKRLRNFNKSKEDYLKNLRNKCRPFDKDVLKKLYEKITNE